MVKYKLIYKAPKFGVMITTLEAEPTKVIEALVAFEKALKEKYTLIPEMAIEILALEKL